jgi:hypothetical protein
LSGTFHAEIFSRKIFFLVFSWLVFFIFYSLFSFLLLFLLLLFLLLVLLLLLLILLLLLPHLPYFSSFTSPNSASPPPFLSPFSTILSSQDVAKGLCEMTEQVTAFQTAQGRRISSQTKS